MSVMIVAAGGGRCPNVAAVIFWQLFFEYTWITTIPPTPAMPHRIRFPTKLARRRISPAHLPKPITCPHISARPWMPVVGLVTVR